MKALIVRHLVLAASVLLVVSSSAQAQHFPWKRGDKPPTLAGFRLYETPADARARLGADATVDTLGGHSDPAVAYTSAKRGISLVTSRLDGVAIIYVTRREAGVLDSVRVGDSRDRVLARWGQPTSAEGNNALWLVDDWVIVVELGAGDRVVRLGVGRQG
jgi:hypothetical protein